MFYFEVILGGVLCFAAFLSLVVAIAEEPGVLVLFGVFGVVGGLLLSAGVHRDWADTRAKHQAIYRDAVRQGYPVRDSDVHAGYGETLDVRVGRCSFSLLAERVGGRWRFGVERSGVDGTGGIDFLSPADAAKLGEACPR